MIERHRAKIEVERTNLRPDEARIAHWQPEIEVWEQQMARLNRRLKREW